MCLPGRQLADGVDNSRSRFLSITREVDEARRAHDAFRALTPVAVKRGIMRGSLSAALSTGHVDKALLARGDFWRFAIHTQDTPCGSPAICKMKSMLANKYVAPLSLGAVLDERRACSGSHSAIPGALMGERVRCVMWLS